MGNLGLPSGQYGPAPASRPSDERPDLVCAPDRASGHAGSESGGYLCLRARVLVGADVEHGSNFSDQGGQDHAGAALLTRWWQPLARASSKPQHRLVLHR